MGLIDKIVQIDKKFGWSFMGFVLAVLFGGIAIYTEFIRENNPVIKYEILNNTNILDVKEDVSGLSIIYNNEDIRKSHKKLSVLVLKVSNEGRSPILKSHYDSDDPLGLIINGDSTEIIKKEVVSATSKYLKNNMKIKVERSNEVTFSQSIIDPNESFVVKLLILSLDERLFKLDKILKKDNDKATLSQISSGAVGGAALLGYKATEKILIEMIQKPDDNDCIKIKPIGKIAGVKDILLIDRSLDQKSEPFIKKVISGSIWVQLSRLTFYFFVMIIIFIFTIRPYIFISNKIEVIKRDGIIKKYKAGQNSTLNELNNKVYEFYKKRGKDGLREVNIYLLQSVRNFDEANTFFLEPLLEMELISNSDKGFVKNLERINAMKEFYWFSK